MFHNGRIISFQRHAKHLKMKARYTFFQIGFESSKCRVKPVCKTWVHFLSWAMRAFVAIIWWAFIQIQCLMLYGSLRSSLWLLSEVWLYRLGFLPRKPLCFTFSWRLSFLWKLNKNYCIYQQTVWRIVNQGKS